MIIHCALEYDLLLVVHKGVMFDDGDSENDMLYFTCSLLTMTRT
jgi:hypothetical protein